MASVTPKNKGVIKANGSNGNKATGCILHPTRSLLHHYAIKENPDKIGVFAVI